MESENKVVQEPINEVVEGEMKQPVTEKRCPNCQALLEEGQTFCSECGTPLKKLCQKCGTELMEDQVFCSKCGQRTDGPMDAGANSAINQFNANVSVKQQKNKRTPIIIGGVCAAVIAVAILYGKFGSGIDFKTTFADIANESWCDIASDGSYMKLDTNPYDIDDSFNSDAWKKIEEANITLGFSEALMGKMGETRSIDGRQTDENDNFKVTWTYHPDRGLEVMYEKK